MQELKELLKSKLASGAVSQILGWKAGETALDPEPAFFKSPESLDEFVYNGFCGANLSKYLIGVKEPTLVLLKPCDSYSFNQLITQHRVDRDKAYIIGVGCKGKLAIERIKKSINVYKKSIERSEREIMLFNSIIDSKDSLTYEQMVEMRNGKK